MSMTAADWTFLIFGGLSLAGLAAASARIAADRVASRRIERRMCPKCGHRLTVRHADSISWIVLCSECGWGMRR